MLPKRCARDRWLALGLAAVFSAALVALACGRSDPPQYDLATPTPSPTPLITPTPAALALSSAVAWTFGAAPAADDGLATVTEDELRADVRFLASEDLAGRQAGQAGADAAAAWIAQELEGVGLGPGAGESFLQPFSIDFGSGSTANVVARLEGSDGVLRDEVIVVGAHYDHLGVRDGLLCPGADDNASGTVALIEVAEALFALRGNLPRTVLFVAFSGEEEGLLGSRHFVQEPPVPLERIVYMVNLDMIGHLAGRSLRLYNASEIPAMAELALALSAAEGVTAQAQGTIGGSDHIPFRAAGIPVVFLHTGLTWTYHGPDDKPDTLDYAGMRAISRVTARLVWGIAHGKRVGTGPLAPLRLGAPLDHDARPFLRP